MTTHRAGTNLLDSRAGVTVCTALVTSIVAAVLAAPAQAAPAPPAARPSSFTAGRAAPSTHATKASLSATPPLRPGRAGTPSGRESLAPTVYIPSSHRVDPTSRAVASPSVVRGAITIAAATFAGTVQSDVQTLPGGGGGATFHPYANPSRPTTWGVTSLISCEAWINPQTPPQYLLAVVRHEYGHVLQCRIYGGNLNAELADAGGMDEIERIADAVALALGANWTGYTSNPSAFERSAASRLLSGRRMR